MKHTLQSIYDRGSRWVKNAANFVSDHPLLFVAGGLAGSGLAYATRPAPPQFNLGASGEGQAHIPRASTTQSHSGRFGR